VAAVEQYNNRSDAFVEIARPYAVYIDEFLSDHACTFDSELL
jgi:hypothetical protein